MDNMLLALIFAATLVAPAVLFARAWSDILRSVDEETDDEWWDRQW